MALARKVEKNKGQEGAVKLLPMEESNGEGRGVVITVTDGELLVDVEVGVSLSFAVEDSDVDEGNDDILVEVPDPDENEDECPEVDEGRLDSEDELKEPPRLSSMGSCLPWSRPRGGGLVSICISPLAASSLKCAESSTRGIPAVSYAAVHEITVRITSSNDMLIENGCVERLLPGRGLCGEECILETP